MVAQLRALAVASLIFVLFLGLGYTLVGVGLSSALFHYQATGSVGRNGSVLIGQSWQGPRWFHGRDDQDDPLVADGKPGSSGASNLGPRSEALYQDARGMIRYWRREGVSPTVDLVTGSGSGLDPDITPADAIAQIPMISRARHLAPERLRRLIRSETQGAQLGFLGPSYVDVLRLNEALARLR